MVNPLLIGPILFVIELVLSVSSDVSVVNYLMAATRIRVYSRSFVIQTVWMQQRLL